MSPPHDQDTLVAPRPHQPTDDLGNPKNDVTLTTSVNGTTISITGDGDYTCKQNQAATHFNFTLQDTSGGNVKFASLDTCDNIDTCPPTGSGNQSSQITGISMHNNSNNNQPNTAAFTDKNNNPAVNGEMNVSYQWNFTCDPPFTVLPFDPIIKNGGNTGPIT